MKIDYLSSKNESSTMKNFVDYLENTEKNLWDYKGFKVEIDPTVDYNSNNILVRWTDIIEGFNDKTIYHSLSDFLADFNPIKDA